MEPSKLLMKSVLTLVVISNLSEEECNNLKQTNIMSMHMDPDGAWVETELTFKDGSTRELNFEVEDFDSIPFADLFNTVIENEEKYNSSKWAESGMYDVTDVPIIYCEKCKFPTTHRFDYCPGCGRKMITKEKK